jgi:hypothetical protein
MTFYTLLLSLHVVVAVLGAGQLAAMAVLCSQRETAAVPRLLWNARIALVILLTTGAALDLRAGGVWHGYWWFRGSALLLVLVALLGWLTQRALQKQQYAAVRRSALTMCCMVAIITALMEWKPL